MRGHRCELGAGGEDGREVINGLHLILGEDPFEEVSL